jgi:hypothetical protein
MSGRSVLLVSFLSVCCVIWARIVYSWSVSVIVAIIVIK